MLKNSTSIPRSIRLARLQHLLHKHPQGLTSHELAQLSNVCVRTIQRDLLDLQSDLSVPITQDGNRYGILGGYTLPPIFFSLYEAMALFLASRLILRQTDEYNPYVQQALFKLSDVLPSPVSERVKAGIKMISMKKSNPVFLAIFESVAVAWTTQRQLCLEYLSLGSEKIKEWIVDPYFVEMTGIGYSIYVIGHGVREGKKGIMTFKLDRIQSAHVLDSSFEIPPELDLESLLASSWGVMWGDDTQIKLRFSPRVTRRVKESIWHPSQLIEDQPDGGCVMTLLVGSTLEVTPWIRSWGPDVEVLEPEALREEFRQYAIDLNEIYKNK